MLKRFLVLVVLGGLATAGTMLAQAKLAIIDLQKAVLNSAEIKKAQAELETKFRPRQQAMAKLEQDLQQVQTQLQTGAAKMTQQQAEDLQATGTRKQRELQRLGEDLQADVDRERNEILQRSGQRMTDVVKKLAEEKGLDVVIEASNAIFFKPVFDLTADATTAYDKTYPAAK